MGKKTDTGSTQVFEAKALSQFAEKKVYLGNSLKALCYNRHGINLGIK